MSPLTLAFVLLGPPQPPEPVDAQGAAQEGDDDAASELVVETPRPATPDPGLSLTTAAKEIMPVLPPRPSDTTTILEIWPAFVDLGVAGDTLGGMTRAESRSTLDHFDITNPGSRTSALALPLRFLWQVTTHTSGYEAEHGWASGGQIHVHTSEPSHYFRTEVGVRVSPRVANPRLLSPTDDALRVTEIDDLQIQAHVLSQGPVLINRKLLYVVGVVLNRRFSTLRQSFRRRLDLDGSGGFEGCPYQNGANDCAPGQGAIATETFAEQSFPTGATELGYLAQLDWHIDGPHRMRVAVTGGPSFVRTSYRLPYNPEPNAFGANPLVDPIGGTSRNATGLVNDHFGTTLRHQTVAVLGYEGLIDRKLGVEAMLGYGQFVSQEAWRLDNPALREIPATQYDSDGGRNLYEHLEREGATALVPGVAEACNDELPGVACPTRTWVSGGLGEYDHDVSRRVGARLAMDGIVWLGGRHWIRGGAELDWTQRRGIYRYSGANDDDFSSNCAASRLGGGEYCYDPRDDVYELDNAVRVNNNRFVLVDADDPNLRRTRGFGTAQHEREDLRALADPDGHGVRVPTYDETVSNFNYALFLQDRWNLAPNLAAHGGLRWEIQDMRDIYGRSKLLILDSVAPRVGLAYDWTGTGRSRASVDYGLYYQPLPLQLASRMFGGLVMVERRYRASDCETGTTTLDGVSHPRVDEGQPSEWCVDYGGTTTGLSEAAVVPRLRGQYNHQLALGYAQELFRDVVLALSWRHTALGRAVEDVSLNGGQDFVLANPGVAVAAADVAAQQAECEALAADPDATDARELRRCQAVLDSYARVGTAFDKPTRNYDGWTIQLDKHYGKDWMLSTRYTYSRLVGDYDGFVDPINGSITLGAPGHYDTPERLRNGFGRLARDVPHRLWLSGYYGLDLRSAGRLIFGTTLVVRSGVPVSVRAGDRHLLPRGTGGRMQPNAQWNVQVAYSYPLPKATELEFGVDVRNVTNAKATLRVDEVYSRDPARPIVGGEPEDLAHAKILSSEGGGFFGREVVRPQGNFGHPVQLQQPITAQFELTLHF